MLLSRNGVYESEELHKMEETKEKETEEKLKLSTIRVVVISETCLLIIRHKKKVVEVDPLIYYFVFALKMSIGLLVCCICTRNLHETRKLHQNMCVCVRTYVGVAVT